MPTFSAVRTDRCVAAFKERYNLAGLASLAGLTLLFGPALLLLGVCAEAAYLCFVPGSRWYAARLARREDVESTRRREALKAEILPQLRPVTQEHFLHLEEMRTQIDAQAGESGPYGSVVPRRLDYLLERYLHFARKEVQFRNYLLALREEAGSWHINVRRVRDAAAIMNTPLPPPISVDPSDRWTQRAMSDVQHAYAQEMARLRGMIRIEQDPDTKALLEKRAEVMLRRQEYLAKIGRALINLHHQMQLLEDTLGLVNDEIRARAPEQILEEISDVVLQTDAMTRILEEIAPYEQLAARLKMAE